MPSFRVFLVILSIITHSVVSVHISFAFSVPDGWRELSQDEFTNEIRRDESKDFISVTGDFNGDGVLDEAKLLVTTDGSKMGIVVWISDKDQLKLFVLGEYEAWPKGMGIDLVSPGDYKTACGKGYWACKPDEPATLILTTDAINYFRFESANSFFFWDNKLQAFNRVWISD